MSRRYPAIPPECETCPLPDCYPTDSRCPILRAKAAKAGLTLPEVPADTPIRLGARKYDGLVPEKFEDRADYQRQYNLAYKKRFNKVLLRGVYLKKEDIEILRLVCEKEGRTLEGELVLLLGLMVENARRGQREEG